MNSKTSFMFLNTKTAGMCSAMRFDNKKKRKLDNLHIAVNHSWCARMYEYMCIMYTI